MKERPPCEYCGKPALMMVFDGYYCGECVAKMDKINKEKQRTQMKELLDGI